MTTTTICDNCGGTVGARGLDVAVGAAEDDDNDVGILEADLCSWACLVQWAGKQGELGDVDAVSGVGPAFMHRIDPVSL